MQATSAQVVDGAGDQLLARAGLASVVASAPPRTVHVGGGVAKQVFSVGLDAASSAIRHTGCTAVLAGQAPRRTWPGVCLTSSRVPTTTLQGSTYETSRTDLQLQPINPDWIRKGAPVARALTVMNLHPVRGGRRVGSQARRSINRHAVKACAVCEVTASRPAYRRRTQARCHLPAIIRSREISLPPTNLPVATLLVLVPPFYARAMAAAMHIARQEQHDD